MAYDFDFQRYVDRKKNPGGGHEERGGFADYAFAGDIRVLRNLRRLTPVRIVAKASVRAFKTFQKNSLLGKSVKVSSRQFPQIHSLVAECAEALDIPMPTVYVSQSPFINAGTYGTEDESFILIKSGLVDSLSDDELRFVIGHECGHIQNQHVVYATTAEFMKQGIGVYVKWAVIPATTAINAWSRRAEVTCDRAGMVCCRDEDIALNTIMKLAVGKSLSEEMDLDEFESQIEGIKEGVGRFAEVFDSHPYLPKRIKAVRLFAESNYFKNIKGERGGRSLDEIDRDVEEIIKVM
jgi:Zn-dependent protease with chaperone function